MYIRNNESNHYFTDNKPYHFKIQLPFPLIYDGYWKVALCEIHLTRDSKAHNKSSDNTLFIYSSICKESVVNEGEHALLRKVSSNSRNRWQYIFDSPFYWSLKKNRNSRT